MVIFSLESLGGATSSWLEKCACSYTLISPDAVDVKPVRNFVNPFILLESDLIPESRVIARAQLALSSVIMLCVKRHLRMSSC